MSTSQPFSKKGKIQLPSFSKMCDRYGVSDRAAAALASAVLTDIKVVSHNNLENVIDKNKVRRERNTSRVVNSDKRDLLEIQGLFFDGRKDNTLCIEKQGKKTYRKMVKEEHITLVKEPGSFYVGHIVPV